MNKSSQVPVQIASISRIKSKEIVYNFSVKEDESYVLNGIISHNCRCTLGPIGDVQDVEQPDWASFNDWINS